MILKAILDFKMLDNFVSLKFADQKKVDVMLKVLKLIERTNTDTEENEEENQESKIAQKIKEMQDEINLVKAKCTNYTSTIQQINDEVQREISQIKDQLNTSDTDDDDDVDNIKITIGEIEQKIKKETEARSSQIQTLLNRQNKTQSKAEKENAASFVAIKSKIDQLEKVMSKINNNDIISALEYSGKKIKIIKQEKADLNRFDLQLKCASFVTELDLAHKIKRIEETVHKDNKEMMKSVIQKLPDIVKKIAWQEAIKIFDNIFKVYMTSSLVNGLTPNLSVKKTNPDGWIFEKNENGAGYYLKSSSSGGYVYVTFEQQIRIISERQNSDHFYWTLEKAENFMGNEYSILNVKTGKRLGYLLNQLCIDDCSSWQLN